MGMHRAPSETLPPLGDGLPRAQSALAMTHLKNSPCHSEPVRTPAWESASFVGADDSVRPV